MNKDIMAKVKNILRGHDEIFFPVKELYNNRLVSPDLPPFDDLLRELKEQSDLVVTRNLKTRDGDDPVVMLRERIPTLDEIIAKVRTSIGGTLDNLNQAYAAGIGEMAPAEEDMLIETMRRTKQLRDEMERMFAEAKQRPDKTNAPQKSDHGS
jgi:hypothetical protein